MWMSRTNDANEIFEIEVLWLNYNMNGYLERIDGLELRCFNSFIII